jgi:hypothetical protein
LARCPSFREALNELRGKNRLCWCKEGAPCHADVLLELASCDPAVFCFGHHSAAGAKKQETGVRPRADDRDEQQGAEA